MIHRLYLERNTKEAGSPSLFSETANFVRTVLSSSRLANADGTIAYSALNPDQILSQIPELKAQR